MLPHSHSPAVSPLTAPGSAQHANVPETNAQDVPPRSRHYELNPRRLARQLGRLKAELKCNANLEPSGNALYDVDAAAIFVLRQHRDWSTRLRREPATEPQRPLLRRVATLAEALLRANALFLNAEFPCANDVPVSATELGELRLQLKHAAQLFEHALRALVSQLPGLFTEVPLDRLFQASKLYETAVETQRQPKPVFE